MADATKQEISRWFDECQEKDKRYMVIVCDTFDYTDYPCACNHEEAVAKIKDPGSMQRVMEVYDVTKDKESQLDMRRCFATIELEEEPRSPETSHQYHMQCNDCGRCWIGMEEDWCPSCKSSSTEPDQEPGSV